MTWKPIRIPLLIMLISVFAGCQKDGIVEEGGTPYDLTSTGKVVFNVNDQGAGERNEKNTMKIKMFIAVSLILKYSMYIFCHQQ